MEHWQVTYLGIRQIPRELTDFDLATFFTFSAKARALIEARRGDLYRLAIALHLGFIRMSGRTLDAYTPTGKFRKCSGITLAPQLELDPPDLRTLRTLYETRARTLIDHQVLAYQALGFRPMAERQRRYVVRWLKERLTGRPNRGDLLYELKRWLYEHRILFVHDRLLRRFIITAVQDVLESLTNGLIGVFGDTPLNHWSRLLVQPDSDHGSLQQWLWSVPLRQSTHQMSDVFTKSIAFMRSAFIRVGQQFATRPLCGTARGAARAGRPRWVSASSNDRASWKQPASCVTRCAPRPINCYRCCAAGF
ncbi:MAG TPA: DUF4158 domain-containing protein [Burkholderiaceae bacterium]|nr:DUF4158 domain-containing protein [Burkholderiaceae bacterium]